MSNYYLIIQKKGNHRSIVDSLGGSSGINDNLIFNQDIKDQLIYNVKSAFEIIPLAAHIFTRRGDYQKSSHETNKLWSALTTYQFVSISYETLMSLREDGDIDLKPFLVSEEQFAKEINDSDAMASILEMNSLAKILPRKEVVLEVAFNDANWCYVTDFYDRSKLEDKVIVEIEVPLHIDTDSVKEYITERVGVEYKFNF